MNLLFFRRWALQLVLWSMVSLDSFFLVLNVKFNHILLHVDLLIMHMKLDLDFFFNPYLVITSCFLPGIYSSLGGADEGVLWAAGWLGGPSAHSVGFRHMRTVHHQSQDVRVGRGSTNPAFHLFCVNILGGFATDKNLAFRLRYFCWNIIYSPN